MAASASTADRYGQAPARMNSLKAKLQDPTVQGLLLLGAGGAGLCAVRLLPDAATSSS